MRLVVALLVALPVLAQDDLTRMVNFDSPSVELIHALGPGAMDDVSTNKVDLVILGDGYKADQMGDFVKHSDRMKDAILAAEPFKTYAAFIRIWRVRCISTESGSAHDVKLKDGTTEHKTKDTCFGTFYAFAAGDNGPVGRALCSEGKANIETVFRMIPDPDICLVIANDPNYGGAADPLPGLLTVYKGGAMDVITIHELGHAMAGLGDEYSLAKNEFTEAEPASANLTKVGSRDEVKWKAWLDSEVPLKDGTKAPISVFAGGAGTFASGVYRPTDNGCRMNDNYKDYCFVCREAVIRSIYEGSSPIIGSGCVENPDRPGWLRIYVDEIVPPGSAYVAFKVNDLWLSPTTSEPLTGDGAYRYVLELPSTDDWGWVTAAVLDRSALLKIPDREWGYTFEWDYVHIRAVGLLEAK